MKKRVFIIHGWGASPSEDWFPWLKKHLMKKGIKVVVPAMPDTNYPVIDDWVSCLSKKVGHIDKDTYFVGHSIGCQTIIRYLEKLKPSDKVGGVLLVAGWFILKNLDKKEKIIARPWLDTKINFNKVRKIANNIIVLLSDNDPVVPLVSNKRIFKNRLGAKIVTEHAQGHFNGSDGIKKLPVVVRLLSGLTENEA